MALKVIGARSRTDDNVSQVCILADHGLAGRERAESMEGIGCKAQIMIDYIGIDAQL